MDNVKADAMYEVKLKKSVKLGAGWLRPNMGRVVVSGKALPSIEDAVASYKEVK